MDISLFESNAVKSNRIVYTPSAFAKSNLIYLQEIGSMQYLRPHISRREKLNSYLFIQVQNGSASVDYHSTLYLLKTGDCAFLDCHYPYVRQSDASCNLNWIHFAGPNMAAIYEKYLKRSGSPCFSPVMPALFQTIYGDIFELASSDDYVRDMHLMEKITSLLSLLMESNWRYSLQVKPSKARQELQPIKCYLDEHYMETIHLEDLANRFFINKFYLARIFKEAYAVSINRYITQIRITHAKQLLRFSNHSIDETGAQCGLYDPNYFSRVFKKIEGVSPSQYREEWASQKS
ncbi:AraC family transcriptional regulator [Ethanoligenens harbinense]|uniref:Transcriptional regulator, AraC family n=1 Tax=Ethanoligenens harbinense (strain DSM 18485 / JCM 12961 / CGMCC 1.5033 / YUAN-3) TaxID=663278 RepID=E6U4X9_ETHHY|nr:AraC family transcriptional regulator [Ethanoligenens harbinense]ADU27864.1 transcriptional regulator, AraC family [Ethanoligenens harbinense YUAN-3]AVQ96888.1 AraC family transcriptional regulator [Ethanoligenens harbinense YUAN-3]AYF39549.1 AraC family transcriptional regulator [Ethanoligenens harbinense]AYF42375.1 AraC family transcriptional regulator [Ethanoligenens harbinense]QCN93128.1 AraC family transcriptional regulator [Ethanoligenens harbinense]